MKGALQKLRENGAVKLPMTEGLYNKNRIKNQAALAIENVSTVAGLRMKSSVRQILFLTRITNQTGHNVRI